MEQSHDRGAVIFLPSMGLLTMSIPTQVRLIHCAETIKGGIATYLRELLAQQVQAFKAREIAVVVPQSQLTELPRLDGVVVHSYEDVPGQRVRNAFKLGRQVLTLMLANPAAVVHVHSTFAGVTVRALAALVGRAKALVYCPHGWAWDRPMNPLARRVTQSLERALSWVSGAIVCISDHERQTGIQAGISASKLHVVLNGVAAHAPTPQPMAVDWPQDRLRVLFVGRFDRQKGVDLFCQAMAQMQSEVYAVMAGGAVLGDAISIQLPPNAHLAGWVSASQLEYLLRASDVLVVPSRWEGFGLIAAEAMRAGVAVVAAKVGGLAEVVDHERTGVLIEPESVAAICQALRSHTVQEWHDMGTQGKLRFDRRFKMERVHTELMALYQRLR